MGEGWQAARQALTFRASERGTSGRRDIRAVVQNGSSLDSELNSFTVTGIALFNGTLTLVSWLQEDCHLVPKQSVGDNSPPFNVSLNHTGLPMA